MTAVELIAECASVGVSLSPLDDGKIYVDPIAKVSDDLRTKLVANKPAIIEYLRAIHRLHIHCVLVKLQSVQPYRDGDSVRWRNEPSLEQRRLLQSYESELIAALTPRALTKDEAATIALWLHDIGETGKADRDYVFNQANSSPADRTAWLWMAKGSPMLKEVK